MTGAYLDSLTGYERTGVLGEPTLDRISALLAALGDPQRRFRSVHVTGTNGKGSTSMMAAALFAACGVSSGVYTSPHVDRVGERIIVDGRPVDEAALDHALDRIRDAASAAGLVPTWFEAVTAAAFWLFAEYGVEAAVVEVGMLGRCDATNVIAAGVTVVTNVQLDHTDLAGPTRAHIALEKAGIIEAGSTLILGETDPELRPIFERAGPGRIQTLGADLAWTGRVVRESGSIVDIRTPRSEHRGVRIGMPGAHQCDNAVLALAAVEEFLDVAMPAATVDQALRGLRIPGRGEIAHRDPTVVLDGAHNPAGLLALREAVAELRPPSGPAVLVCGVLAGRDLVVPALRALGSGFDVIIATQPPSARAMPAAVLGSALRDAGLVAKTIPDLGQAIATGLVEAGGSGLVVVTGSLRLIGPARAGLTKRVDPG